VSAWSSYTVNMRQSKERFSPGTRNGLLLLVAFFAMLATWTYLVFAFNGQEKEGICISLWYAKTTAPIGVALTVGVLTCDVPLQERSMRS
jgi:hypothetical protein